MEKLRYRKITEQAGDHTARHLHTWELDRGLLTHVQCLIYCRKMILKVFFSVWVFFLACKFKVQCIAFSDWMKHCTEKFEGTCQKMYNDCLEIQATNYTPRENTQSVLFGFVERKYLYCLSSSSPVEKQWSCIGAQFPLCLSKPTRGEANDFWQSD